MTGRQILLARYVETHPEDVARQVDALPATEVGSLLSAMSPEAAAILLPYLTPAQAAGGLIALDPADAAGVLNLIAPDIVASLLRRVGADAAETLLAAIAPARAAALRAVLAHPPDSAGGVMDPLVLAIPISTTVSEARALLERHPDHLYYYLYVVDAEHRLEGVIDIAELLQAQPGTPVGAMVRTNLTWLAAELPLDAVFAHSGWRLYDALPVLDGQRRFLGVLRHRRMRQLLSSHKPLAPAEPGVRTALALGEIYWLGLCGLLEGIASAASGPVSRRTTP